MTDRKQLEDLRDRLVKATGPDRELDCYLHAALALRGPVTIVEPPAYDQRRFFCLPTAHTGMNWIGYDLLNVAPPYTFRIDFALGLRSDGAEYQLRTLYGIATFECPLNGGDNDLPITVRRRDGNEALSICQWCVKYELAKTKATT